jgi:lipoprotein-releasing system permease protein
LGNVASSLAITDIRNVQKINRWEQSQITGYACHLDAPELSIATADNINTRLIYDYQGEENIAAVIAEELHADIFGWLETHDVNATVILVIMLVVAIFNVVTALLILVLERTRMVGTLKSMGMANKAIRRIFTHHAARITLRGVIIGNAIALVLLVVQQQFHIVKLDESGYFLSEVPVALGAGWMVAVNILFATIIVAVTHIATSIVGRIKVAEALKYE